MKKFLEYILAFLGFAGCNIIGDQAEAYGTPHAEFEVKGVVTDGENPIENVQVKLISGHHGYEWEVAKADTTDKEGQFLLHFGYDIFDTLHLKVTTTDLNNTYQNDTSEIDFLWKELKGSKKKKNDDWYEGKATKTVNFTLTEKGNK